jgi:hypothetical protein
MMKKIVDRSNKNGIMKSPALLRIGTAPPRRTVMRGAARPPEGGLC